MVVGVSDDVLIAKLIEIVVKVSLLFIVIGHFMSVEFVYFVDAVITIRTVSASGPTVWIHGDGADDSVVTGMNP